MKGLQAKQYGSDSGRRASPVAALVLILTIALPSLLYVLLPSPASSAPGAGSNVIGESFPPIAITGTNQAAGDLTIDLAPGTTWNSGDKICIQVEEAGDSYNANPSAVTWAGVSSYDVALGPGDSSAPMVSISFSGNLATVSFLNSAPAQPAAMGLNLKGISYNTSSATVGAVLIYAGFDAIPGTPPVDTDFTTGPSASNAVVGTSGTTAPTITTSLQYSSIPADTFDLDTVTVSGTPTLGPPTGTIYFALCGPTEYVEACGAPFLYPEPLTANSSDSAQAAMSDGIDITPGVWCYGVEYSGDSKYSPATDSGSDQCYNVTPIISCPASQLCSATVATNVGKIEVEGTSSISANLSIRLEEDTLNCGPGYDYQNETLNLSESNFVATSLTVVDTLTRATNVNSYRVCYSDPTDFVDSAGASVNTGFLAKCSQVSNVAPCAVSIKANSTRTVVATFLVLPGDPKVQVECKLSKNLCSQGLVANSRVRPRTKC